MLVNLNDIQQVFINNGVENATAEAQRFFEIAAGDTGGNGYDRPIDIDQSSLDMIAKKRKTGEPIEYIVGLSRFANLEFYCSRDVIIPTEYTITLVNVALEFLNRERNSNYLKTVVEVGTGCGNIAVLLAKKADNVRILASDVSPKALVIAEKNIEKHCLNDRISLFCGDLFEPFLKNNLARKVDMVLCNPPYIPTKFLKKLPRDVVDYQPIVALDGGPYGITFFQRLVKEAEQVLKPGGILIFEIGDGQEKFVNWIIKRHLGYENLVCHKDNAGVKRVYSAQKIDVISNIFKDDETGRTAIGNTFSN